MPDGSSPDSNALGAPKLALKDMLSLNEGYIRRLEAAFVDSPIAVKIINGGSFGTDALKFCEIKDRSSWTVIVSRSQNIPGRLVVKSHHSSVRNPSAFIEQAVEIDRVPETPGIGIRETIIGDPQYVGEPQSTSYDKTSTVPLVEKVISRTEQQLRPMLILPKAG